MSACRWNWPASPIPRPAPAPNSPPSACRHRLDHYPTQLSGGEQQRVGLARAIAARPALIFADEPTGNLDATTGEAVVEMLFARLAETGATLVLITHDAALAARCDRVIEMKDGHIIRDERQAPAPLRAAE